MSTRTSDNSLTLGQQFAIQMRVIWALTLRETVTRFGREGLGMLWMIGEPAMFIIGVMIIFSLIDQGYGSVGVGEYMAVSYPTLLFWRNGTGRVVKALEVNKALLHHRQIRPLDIIYARIVLEFSGSMAVFFFLFPILVFVGVCQFPANPFEMCIGYILIIWFSFAFVMIMGALSDMSETIERISHIILYMMMPFSGVFLPTYIVPEPYRGYLLYFPLVDAVEYFHHGYFGDRMLTYYHLGYTSFALLVMTVFAYMLTYIAVGRVRRL